jgi:predicted amidohydrolase YtcJ
MCRQLLLSVCSLAVLSSSANAADAIYSGGDILTMAGPEPAYVEALVVDQGRIVFTGAVSDAMKLKSSDTKIVDLQGHILMPGFQDTHGHLLLKMHNLLKLDLTGAATPDEVLARFKTYIKERDLGPKDWALGYLVPKPQDLGRLLTRDDLDKISTEIPIFAQEASGHIATVNTAGLRKLGITADTPDPTGGTYRRYAGSTEPNGILDEAAVIQAFNALPPIPEDKIEPLLAEASALWLKYGFTTARDILTGLSPDDFAIARRAAEKDLLPLDLILYANAQLGEEAILEHKDWINAYVGRVKLGGVKMMIDGVPNSYTAFMREPYPNLPEGYESHYSGFLNVQAEDVMKYVDLYYDTGLQLNAHVMGDGAIDLYLTALELAEAKYGRKDKRPMAHHAGLVTPDLVDRFSATGTVAVFNSAAISGFGSSGEYFWGKDASNFIMPARTLLDYGVPVTVSTDCPSGPSEPDVFRDIFGIVTRKSFSDDYVMGPGQRITVYEALSGITRTGAWGNFEEETKGTLEVGKLADLVVLDRNPLKIDPMTLTEVRVLETIKEGETVYFASRATNP